MRCNSTVVMLTMFGAFSTACSTEVPTTGSTELASTAKKKHSTVTKIIVNGESASVPLLDSAGTNGFLTVTRDNVANTTGLDFSWATPDPTNADLAILFQGAGQIPNNAFTQTATSAQLSMTTAADFSVAECIVNINTGDFTCATTAPLTFNLTWLGNGFGSTHEVSRRVETLGPVTTKVNAEFTTITANVDGTWGGRSDPSLTGTLTDSGSKTYIREITTAY